MSPAATESERLTPASRRRPTRPRPSRRGGLVVLLVLILLVFWSASGLDIRLDRLQGIANLFILLREAFPPDAGLAAIAAEAVVETIQIALLGTFLGGVLSLPLGLLASRNLFNRYVTLPARTVLAAIRTLPALLWAVLFVVAVGLGPLAGVLASSLYTVGFLGKLQYEAIEGIDPGPLQAVAATGASKAQVIRYVVLPESANHLISQLLFMFEYNVRASSIFGFVGAGGIGFYIAGYLTVFRYQSVFTLLLAVFFTVMLIDYISVRIRDRYLVPTGVRKPAAAPPSSPLKP